VYHFYPLFIIFDLAHSICLRVAVFNLSFEKGIVLVLRACGFVVICRAFEKTQGARALKFSREK
jgi:hypothetical protein